MQPLLKLTNIKRSYGAIQALRGADFEIMPGEVIGLVGENGAGKSTMVKIISGFDSGFTGEYLLNGEALHFNSPIQAERAGIAVADFCGRAVFIR
jgi:ABC-type sugar transport system ATPase subunit